MYSDNTLFTSVTATTTDNLKNFGYKTSNQDHLWEPNLNNLKILFSPEFSISPEKLETTSKLLQT